MRCVSGLCAAARRDGAGFRRTTFESFQVPVGECEFESVSDESAMASATASGSSPRERIRTCYDVFFAICHADTAWGHAFDRLRQRCRSGHRRRAMGRSGIRVDLDLGMRVLLQAIGFKDIHRDFLQGRPDAGLWIEEQLLRAVFRWGLVSRWWRRVVARWPCAPHLRLGPALAPRLTLTLPTAITHACDHMQTVCTGCATLVC